MIIKNRQNYLEWLRNYGNRYGEWSAHDTANLDNPETFQSRPYLPLKFGVTFSFFFLTFFASLSPGRYVR